MRAPDPPGTAAPEEPAADSGAASASSSPFPPGLSKWDRASIAALGPRELSALKAVIDHLALLSAQSQRLKVPLSTVGRLLSSEYALYTLADEEGRALGFIKLGRKCLYVTNPGGMMIQVKPLCVLDFYVHGSVQRRGLGARLLAQACKEEGLSGPHELAYDRPSPQLLPFLRKHFGLRRFTPQHNHFVLFDQFFDEHERRLQEERARKQQHQRTQQPPQPLPPLLLPGMDPHPPTAATTTTAQQQRRRHRHPAPPPPPPQQQQLPPHQHHHQQHRPRHSSSSSVLPLGVSGDVGTDSSPASPSMAAAGPRAASSMSMRAF